MGNAALVLEVDGAVERLRFPSDDYYLEFEVTHLDKQQTLRVALRGACTAGHALCLPAHPDQSPRYPRLGGALQRPQWRHACGLGSPH